MDFIKSELGKDTGIQKEWQEFNKEVKDEFTSIDTDVVDENGFDTYTVVAGELVVVKTNRAAYKLALSSWLPF